MLKRLMTAALLMMTVGFAVVAADEDAVKKLDGIYEMKALSKGGEAAPEEIMKAFESITIKGESFTMKVAGQEKSAKVKFDATKTPATMDLTPTDGPTKDKAMLGIYKVEKDQLTILMAEEGNDRPKDFKSEEGIKMVLKKKPTEEKKDK